MKIPSLNKNLKIIIIGFGSIGQRRYRTLLKLGFNNIHVFDIDKTKTAGKKLKTIPELNIRELERFDVALICNPNNFHIQTATICAQSRCHLFIEKPLSHNLKGVEQLIRLCRKRKLINMVACNMRFHPCLKFIKSYLQHKKLGKVYSISHELGHYLPYWRPKSDYRKNYAARKATGGGIILDDMHEFDLLFWLNDYQEVLESKWIYDKVSNLEIETEDICIASFKFKNKVLGLVKCDYLQKSYTRNCKIVGEKGSLEWDYTENIVWLKNQQGRKKLFGVKNYDIDKFYVDEMKYFLNCIGNKQRTFNDIKIAFNTLKYCLRHEK